MSFEDHLERMKRGIHAVTPELFGLAIDIARKDRDLALATARYNNARKTSVLAQIHANVISRELTELKERWEALTALVPKEAE